MRAPSERASLEKAIEIKRRAQRYVQSGDIDAALVEYEKLARAEENEPYHSVVIADLLFKKGANTDAGQRYLIAIDGYERAGLYKNGIAVCKKMARLNLSPLPVLERLARLHELDGIHTEAAMYYVQHAESAMRVDETGIAAQSFRRAFQTAPDYVMALEKLANLHASNGDRAKAEEVLREAIAEYDRRKQTNDIERCEALLAELNGSKPSAHRSERAAAVETETPAPEAARNGAPEAAAPIAPAPRPTRPPTLSPLGGPPKLTLGGDTNASQEAAPASAEDDKRMGRMLDLTGSALESAPAESVAAPVIPAPEPATPMSIGAAAAVADAESSEAGLELEPTTLNPPESEPAPDPAKALQEALARMSQVLTTPVGANKAAAQTAEPVANPQPAPNGIKAVESAPSGANGTPAISDEAPGAARHDGRPGLRFDAAPDTQTQSPQDGDELFWSLVPDAADTPEILATIQEARERFIARDRDGAVQLLVRAAQAYDGAGQLDHAARVHRALRLHLPPVRPALMVWFENCRRRGDRAEGARVACDLGDEAANRGDLVTAREWYGRAHTLDAGLQIAVDRLAAMGVSADAAMGQSNGGTQSATGGNSPPRLKVPMLNRPGGPSVTAPASAPTPSPTAEQDPDRIEITYGYGVDENLDLSGLVDAFRREVQPHVSGDAPSQYALGVSYLEMGLIDQAIESLRAAAEDPTLKGAACELIGRCHMDHGRFEEAVTEFRTALDQPGVTGDSALKMRFELGLALEAAGRLDEGLAEFDRVYSSQPNFPDVALKIRSLRRALETD